MNLVQNNVVDALLSEGILGLAVFTVGTLGVVRPIKTPYAFNPSMTISDITLSDFDGSAAKAQSAVPVTQTDPFTNVPLVWLADPAGGWNWTTTGATNLPQTVYGFALLNAGGTVLEGVTDPLTTPVPLTVQGQGVSAGKMGFRCLASGYTSNDSL